MIGADIVCARYSVSYISTKRRQKELIWKMRERKSNETRYFAYRVSCASIAPTVKVVKTYTRSFPDES